MQTKHGNQKDKHALGLPQWQVARALYAAPAASGNFSCFFFGIFIAHGQLAGRQQQQQQRELQLIGSNLPFNNTHFISFSYAQMLHFTSALSSLPVSLSVALPVAVAVAH